MVSSNCGVCGSKKFRFIKEQEPSGLLSSLGIRTHLSKIPLVAPILFWKYKKNDIINKFLLARDKFMPEMRLRQPGFKHSDFGPFTKNKKRIKNVKGADDSRYIYQNE